MAYYERLNIKDIFQEEVFTDEVMQRYMSEDAYRALKDVIARGDELPRSLADEVAAAMKTWAVEKGATHFALVPADDGIHGRKARQFHFRR